MTAKAKMERQFINLNQEGHTVNYYVAEFTRLSRFAPYMVAQEGDHTRRFLQGLDINIQSHIVVLLFNTFAQVLETIRTQE